MADLEKELLATQEELHQMKTDLTTVISTLFQAAEKMGMDPSNVKNMKMDDVPVMIGQLVMNFQMGMISIDSLGLNSILPVIEKYAHLALSKTK